jgi:hypothetical protein
VVVIGIWYFISIARHDNHHVMKLILLTDS